jgi:hypothetical protein
MGRIFTLLFATVLLSSSFALRCNLIDNLQTVCLSTQFISAAQFDSIDSIESSHRSQRSKASVDADASSSQRYANPIARAGETPRFAAEFMQSSPFGIQLKQTEQEIKQVKQWYQFHSTFRRTHDQTMKLLFHYPHYQRAVASAISALDELKQVGSKLQMNADSLKKQYNALPIDTSDEDLISCSVCFN